MIDKKTLAEDEREIKMLAERYANYPDLFGTFKKRLEIIRLARRYLALRENEIAILQKADIGFCADAYRAAHDAYADRLLDGVE